MDAKGLYDYTTKLMPEPISNGEALGHRFAPLLRSFGRLHNGAAKTDNSTTCWHHDIYEVIYVISGRQRWSIDGQNVDLVGNQLLLIPPNTIHLLHESIRDVCECFWIQISASALHRMCESYDAANVLEKALQTIGKYQFSGSLAMVGFYEALHHERRSSDRLSDVTSSVILLQFVAELVRCHERSGEQSHSPGRHEEILRSVMLACRNAPEEMTVTAMAKVARMPLHQFRSEFSHHAGMTPHEFLVRARIEKAKILLKAGQSVTKCAHQLGFCSSQYFASVFRKFEGQSCSDFLRRDVMAIV